MIEYLRDLEIEINMLANEEGREQGLGGAFTEYMIGLLTEAGEIDDGYAAIYEARGARASGYSLSDDESTLSVFITDFVPTGKVRPLGKVDISTHFRRATTFVEKAIDGLWKQLEESSPAWDMANRIEEVWNNVADLRLVLLTNGHAKGALPELEDLKGARTSFHVWDLDRLHKLDSSGQIQEPITVDFRKYMDTPLSVLGPRGSIGEYESYLAIIPGNVLADIYEDFGPRLLELNVRSFLQARNKVNKGMQLTLKDDPGKFLAYNNGISMTASRVVLEDMPSGGVGVRSIDNLQIVNGGQTTASLNFARTKNGYDLSQVNVQAKISVVAVGLMDQVVPKISEFANSQNKVNMADFSANDPFHVELEKLSRSIWAPGVDGSQHMSRWFYERARGQYADALARERTFTQQRQFRSTHPLSQKFTKTDVAKFENTWDQLPYLVSRGAEKNFREFTIKLRDRGAFTPDSRYFEALVAKAILFRGAEKLIGGLRLGGYRAQTVAYSLALISHKTGQRIDLSTIWKRQRMSESFERELSELAPVVHAHLIESAGRSNVSEWAKKPECWDSVRRLNWMPSASLADELLSEGRRTANKAESSIDEILTEAEKAAMSRVRRVESETWFSLAKWAKETDTLAGWQRSLSVSMGRLASAERSPSRKQAVQAERILDEASRKGFDLERPH